MLQPPQSCWGRVAPSCPAFFAGFPARGLVVLAHLAAGVLLAEDEGAPEASLEGGVRGELQ